MPTTYTVIAVPAGGGPAITLTLGPGGGPLPGIAPGKAYSLNIIGLDSRGKQLFQREQQAAPMPEYAAGRQGYKKLGLHGVL